MTNTYYDSEHLAARRELPIWAHRQQLVEAVASKQVVLVTGDTGSGKTTQLVQVGAGALIRKTDAYVGIFASTCWRTPPAPTRP